MMTLNNNHQAAAKTRQQMREERNHSAEKKARRKRVRVRIIPIWLRTIIVAVLIFLSVIAGATVGYSFMGGGNAKDIFDKSTWTHIIDLVEKE